MKQPSAQTILYVVLGTLFWIGTTACCAQSPDEQEGYWLMVQQNPPEAGVVWPGVGLHRVAANQIVTLTATPAPGYQFLYWLGDVSAAGTLQTTVVVDSPKIIVAMFEKSQFDRLPIELGAIRDGGPDAFWAGAGSGQTAATAGTRASARGGGPVYTAWGPTQDDDSKGPRGKRENPVTPEPATILLLGGGFWVVVSRRRPRRSG